MKKLPLTASSLAAAICVAVMTPQSASAQCTSDERRRSLARLSVRAVQRFCAGLLGSR
jgi:hypothetical protein